MKSVPIYLFNVILLVASTQVMDFVALDNVHVIFFLAPLFYWTVFNPSVMPLWFIFLGGLAIDFSVDSLLGLHAFLFVAYYIFLYRVRRIILSQPLMVHLMVFALSAVFFEVVRFLLLSLLMWKIGVIFPALLSIILNIVAFLPILLVLKFLHRVMSGNGRRQSF